MLKVHFITQYRNYFYLPATLEVGNNFEPVNMKGWKCWFNLDKEYRMEWRYQPPPTLNRKVVIFRLVLR